MSKKILAILLSICMVMSLAPAAMAAEADLTISDAAGLKEFAQAVNNGKTYEGETVVLAKDITLSGEWTPIGTGTRTGNTYTSESKPFKGTFDGGNFTISGLTITSTSGADAAVGLFGVVDGGTVKNLKLTDVNINVSTSELAGGAIGILTGGGTADNITVSGSVSAKRGNGGIVGRMLVSGTISNSVNNATMTATGGANVGGIAGAAYYTAEGKVVNITNCTNNGTITGSAGGVGGIVGLSTGNVTNCTNTAAVKGAGASVGGIVGEQQNYGIVSGCVNSANVTNTTNAGVYGTGGIVGWTRYNGAAANYPLKGIIEVKNNTNSGAVSGGDDAGGIVGVVYNAANITGNENTAASLTASGFAGGIVANVQFTETPIQGTSTDSVTIPKDTVNIKNNVTTTTEANISANCKDLVAYDNSTGSQQGKIENNIVGTPAAKIGSTPYATLAAAIEVAQPGDTIKLLGDITGAETIIVNKSITLDLNGNDIKNTDTGWVLKVDGNSTMTLTDNSTEADGTIEGWRGISVVQGSKLIMDGGNIAVTGATGGGIQIYGSEAIMNGGTITAEYAAILTYSNNNVRATFTMNGGEMNTNGVSIYANGSEAWDKVDVTINDGEVTSALLAIYWPSEGKLTINGGTLTGKTAVYIKSGSLELTGGTLVANGDKKDYVHKPDSGASTTGDALVIENVDAGGYEASEPIVVSGGDFRSANASAVASYAPEGTTAVTGFITGGTYSSDPGALVATGYKAVEGEDGWTVTNKATINYETNGGSAVESETIVTGENAKFTKPANPTKTNYIFAGWYCEAELKNEYSFDSVPAAGDDMTVYAKWTYNPPYIPPVVTPDPEPEEPEEPVVPETPSVDTDSPVVDSTTTENEDGSTTVTEKLENGATVETTTGADGSKTETASKTETVETEEATTTTTVTETTNTAADGTVSTETKVEEVVKTETGTTATTTTTTETAEKTEKVEVKEETVVAEDGTETTTKTTTTEAALANGTTATTVVDAEGAVTAEATVSEEAIAEAAESGAAVTLPVAAVSNADSATITVNTGSTETVKVEIPMTDASAGTVAILVDEEGNETIITETALTEDGVSVPVPDGATIKLVDNSVDFVDVQEDEWHDDAVDYVSARGIMNGTGADIFDPKGNTTRAMVWTMLARLDGVDTSTGSNWYEAGQQWAMENGISDGTNASAEVTREQLVTMIWRYLGEPDSDHDITHFDDHHETSDWALEAKQWAVENGVIKGVTDTTLDPGGDATRAQVAQMFMNFLGL